jgi:hypothetical protein
MILNDRCLKSIDKNTIHARGEIHEFLLIDQVPTLPIGHGVESVAHRLEIHADARGEPGEKETSRSKDTPEFGEHRVKLCVVASEVEDGAAQDDIGECRGKGHLLNASDLKIIIGQVGV